MSPRLPSKTCTLTPIADTGERFSDFAPYVASVNDHGVVAFQAALRQGGMGVFTGDGESIVTVADSAGAQFASFDSHPDINRDHSICGYATLSSGLQGVVGVRDNQASAMVDTARSFARIGPLGPSMNDRGAVAFRADKQSGGQGVFAVAHGDIVTIADSERFGEFYGIPVIDDHGNVVFRASIKGQCQGIYMGDGKSVQVVADTRMQFANLGFFPCINDAGRVVFNATLKAGNMGIYSAINGEITPVIEANGRFESFRGALVNNADMIVFYATPPGGHLGIYIAREAAAERLLAIGDPLFGSAVVEFALNPVSLNHAGQIAIRLRLANERQMIVRADPLSAPIE